MSLVKSKKEVVKVDFTDQEVISESGETGFYIIKYPSLQQYTEFLDAGIKNDPVRLDEAARSIIRDESGELLLKTEDDVIDHEVYEHMLMLITQYLLKLKTKKLSQKDQAGKSN